MFFSLSRSPDSKFSYHYILGRLTLSTDAGWHRSEFGKRILIYKGYMDESVLSENVQWIQDNQHPGNFCVFDYDGNSVTMKTNLYRGFIVWHDQEKLTNLTPGSYAIWTDSSIKIDQDLALQEEKIDVIGAIDTNTISRQDLIDFVHNRLTKKIRSFLANNHLPLRTFCSGGIDSMLVFSYIQAQTDRFKMVWSNHTDWDEFWCRNQKHIRDNFWGYNQIHHWRDSCILSSGTPGDEFMLRSPTTSNLWLKYHGTDIIQELSFDDGRHLHRDYFTLPKHVEIFKQQDQEEIPQNQSNFYRYLCNIVINDCQHWHLGNTLTFTPLRDLEIFKMFLRLNLSDGLPQILDSKISLELIKRNNPSLLEYLSDVKNTGENYANLVGLMSRYPATSGQ